MNAVRALRRTAGAARDGARLALSYAGLRSGLKTVAGDRLEIGSGPGRKPGWVTVDMAPGTDVYWDLRRPLPFADGRFGFVYSSHVLEHFAPADLYRLLRELHRVVRPGGTVSTCVPDARLFVDAYVKRSDPGALLEYAPAVISDKPMDVLNYVFYMDGQHRTMFDPESLTHHFEACGFTGVRERAYDPALDIAERRPTSFYLECTRP